MYCFDKVFFYTVNIFAIKISVYREKALKQSSYKNRKRILAAFLFWSFRFLGRFACFIFIGIFFYYFSPETLSRRLRSKESRAKQKGVVALSGILFIINFLLAGFDFRFWWSSLPSWVVCGASILFVFSYGIYAEVTDLGKWVVVRVGIPSHAPIHPCNYD